MPTPVVWTERGEAPGVVGLHDCTQSAVLMSVIYGNYTNFPEGIYTVAERNLLERSDNRTPEDTGATFADTDAGLKHRYGISMHQLTDDSDATLRAYLNKPGYAFALAGQLSNIGPSTHPLRRWQPSYTGGHALCVITLGNGKLLWLDPLATAKYKGDTTTVDNAMLFAWSGRRYSRYVTQNEYNPVSIQVGDINMHLRPVEDFWTMKPGAPFWVDGPDPKYDGMGTPSTNTPTGTLKGTPDGIYDITILEEWYKNGDTWTSGVWRMLVFPPGTPDHTSGVWVHRHDMDPARQGGALAYREFMQVARWQTGYDPVKDVITKNPFLENATPVDNTQAIKDAVEAALKEQAAKTAALLASAKADAAKAERDKWLEWMKGPA